MKLKIFFSYIPITEKNSVLTSGIRQICLPYSKILSNSDACKVSNSTKVLILSYVAEYQNPSLNHLGITMYVQFCCRYMESQNTQCKYFQLYIILYLLVSSVTSTAQTSVFHHIVLSTAHHPLLNLIGTSCHMITTTDHMTFIDLSPTTSLIQRSLQFTLK